MWSVASACGVPSQKCSWLPFVTLSASLGSDKLVDPTDAGSARNAKSFQVQLLRVAFGIRDINSRIGGASSNSCVRATRAYFMGLPW